MIFTKKNKTKTTKKQQHKNKTKQKTSRYLLQAFDVNTHLWDKLVKCSRGFYFIKRLKYTCMHICFFITFCLFKTLIFETQKKNKQTFHITF